MYYKDTVTMKTCFQMLKTCFQMQMTLCHLLDEEGTSHLKLPVRSRRHAVNWAENVVDERPMKKQSSKRYSVRAAQ
jgi:hypothetical protein